MTAARDPPLRSGAAHTTTAPGDDRAPKYSYQDIYELHATLVRQRNSVVELITTCGGDPGRLRTLHEDVMAPIHEGADSGDKPTLARIAQELSADIRRLGAWLIVEGLCIQPTTL